MASRKKFSDWKTAKDLDYERIIEQDQDWDTSSHKDDYSATVGIPVATTTNKEIEYA